MDIAKSYACVYQHMARQHAKGISVAEHALFTLSVQFLNRATFVNDLVEDYSLLSRLSDSLKDTISSAVGDPMLTKHPVPRVLPDHPILVSRRYSPLIGDLKCVLNIDGMSRRFCVDPPADAIDESTELLVRTGGLPNSCCFDSALGTTLPYSSPRERQ